MNCCFWCAREIWNMARRRVMDGRKKSMQTNKGSCRCVLWEGNGNGSAGACWPSSYSRAWTECQVSMHEFKWKLSNFFISVIVSVHTPLSNCASVILVSIALRRRWALFLASQSPVCRCHGSGLQTGSMWKTNYAPNLVTIFLSMVVFCHQDTLYSSSTGSNGIISDLMFISWIIVLY
jgi:hypothetical protein